MTKWVWKGIRTGIKTTAYPKGEETTPGISPGRPIATPYDEAKRSQDLINLCPMNALEREETKVQVHHKLCIHCLRCKSWDQGSIQWDEGFEWANWTKQGTPFASTFSHSLHIRVLDAGECGACLSEIKQLNNPYYNIHRLGFFITPTPRHADILLIAGPLTEHMVSPLLKTYKAMPAPKRVIAVGTCALSGGPFGKNFTCRGGLSEEIPVDLEIPGCPPPPLAILHALLMISGKQGQSNKGGPSK